MGDSEKIVGTEKSSHNYSDNDGFDVDVRESSMMGDSVSVRAVPRVLTSTLIDALEYITDADQEWTRDMLKNYGDIDEKGPEGDVPDQPPFANDVVFWIMTMFGAGLGVILGFAGLLFMNVIDETPSRWVRTDEFEDPDDGDLYSGKHYWVLVTTGTGLLVGILRWLMTYPDNLPGFFKEVNECHVDPKWAPHTVLLSAISIAGGANLGPEQALGNLGGGLATLVNRYMEFENKEDQNLMVLSGMSGAMGAVFPTPVLAVLMIHELATPPKAFMESTLLMAVPAIMAFIVFYGLEEKTYLERMDANYFLSVNWEFELWQCATAVVIGTVCSASSLCILVAVGIVKQILLRIKDKCDATKFLSGTIVIATLGGLVIGIVDVVVPLAVGNGHQSTISIIQGVQDYSTHVLLVTAFARCFTMAISMNCGFVGGFIFPVISIGVIAGVVCHQQYDYIPLGMSLACFIAAMPAAICPMPFTLFGIVTCLFFVGLQQTVPVFISCITAYLMFTGIGMFSALQERANKAAADRAKNKQNVKEQALSPYTKKGNRFSS